MKLISNLVVYSSVTSTLVPLFSYCVNRKKTFNVQLRVLFFYLLTSFVTDLACLFHLYKDNNNHILNAFTLIEFLSIILIYYFQWDTPKLLSLFVTLGVAFGSYFFVSLFWSIQLDNFYVHINTFEAITVIFLSIFYFFTLVQNLNIPKLTQFYFFWFNAAFLIYFSVVLSVFLFMNYILDPNASQPVKNLWLLHNIFHVVYNCILAVGILKWKKTMV
jgi:hypothetical protein